MKRFLGDIKLKKKIISTAICATSIALLVMGCDSNGKAMDASASNNQIAGESGQNVSGENGQTGDGTGVVIGDAVSVTGGTLGTGKIDTGSLTASGNGYEGTKGTGKYNYGEALQKSLLFYELQRSGDIPEETRCNWRGDSSLKDGSDVGLDLTGGWYDAGDNVKFNLPMAYSAAMLGWSIYEDYDAYVESGQLEYALGNIRWANDYFIKCHPSDEIYYYQVGDGNQDHTYWGAAETVEYKMDRPSYAVTKDNPGSAVCGETAASLAVCSIVFKDIDPDYSELCLEHAKSLYKFAEDTKSDSGYTAANGFYNSWSGYYDELAWAGAWLYIATDDKTYLDKAEQYYPQAGQDYAWAMCWDDVHIGAAVVLARLTDGQVYKDMVEKHLDWWTTGLSNGERVTYSPKGLAWLDSWGSLRYATTTAYIATVYSEWDGCDDSRSKTYWDFAVSQAEYVLGDTGISYEIGYGDNYPKNPHHRTAQGSYCDNMSEPAQARHTLYGALVGGPDANDSYTDEVSNYVNNEVACDYNAGFTGLLAKMYSEYHGETLVDFGAVEEIPINEIYAEGGINVEGTDFIEVKAYICNVSAWPARVPTALEFRYFVDLSEVFDNGGDESDIEITTNYMQGGGDVKLVCWDDDKHIYYVSVDFGNDLIYPGGQSAYKKEIQVRIRNEQGTWDNSNDPSFENMALNSTQLLTKTAIYDGDELIFGEVPAAGNNAGQSVTIIDNGNSGSNDSNSNTGSGNNTSSSTASSTPVSGSAKNENVSVTIDYANMQSSSSSISGTMNIKNESDGSLALSKLVIEYYFTNEDDKSLDISCYHAAINGENGSYTAVSGCSGKYDKASGTDTDTVCKISFSDNIVIDKGATLTVNFSINHSDWSNMNTSNDYSVKSPENIVIYSDSKIIFGTKP